MGGEVETHTRFDVREAAGTSVAVAWDNQLDRTVALKRRVRTKASTARVSEILSITPHPNLTLVRDDIGDEVDHLLVMDFVEGRTLQDVLDAGERLSKHDARQCTTDLAAALAHMHGLKPPVAHGDVKAANVMIVGRAGTRRSVLVDIGFDGATVRGDNAAQRAVVNTLLGRSALKRRRGLVAATLAVGVAFLFAAITLSDGPVRRPRIRAAVHHKVSGPDHRDSVMSGTVPDGVTPLTASGSGALVAAPTVPPGVAALVPKLPTIRSRLAVYWHSVKLGSGEYPAYVDVYHLDRGDLPRLQHSTYGAVPQFTHIVPLNPGWNLCYGALDGVTASVPISRDGVSDWGERLPFQPGFAQVVGDGHGLVWLYRVDTGAVETIRFGRDGYHTYLRHSDGVLAGGFDRASALDPNRALFYSSKSGQAVVLTGAPDATIAHVDQVTLPPGFSVLLYSRGYLFGVRADGRATGYKLAGTRVIEISSFALGGSGWTNGAAFDHGFVLYPRVGLNAIYTQLDAAGHLSSAREWTLPALPIVYEVP
jgi:tRNA A-37 threonylcarbamoyl transferase component Bud32